MRPRRDATRLRGLLSWLVAVAALAPALAGCDSEQGSVGEAVGSSAPAVEVRAGVDRAVATTGDLITFTVEVERADGYAVSVPEPGAEIAGFRITDATQESVSAAGGRTIERNHYRLRADLVGSYILPPVEVTSTAPDGSTTTHSTSEIFVEVESVLPADGEAADIREIKPIEPVERTAGWLVAVAVAAALLAALAALLFYLRRRRQRLDAEPPRPAHEVAFEELARLRRTDFSDLEALRVYYFEISEVLRRYVEARFGLNATDLTTEEIVPRLGELDGVAIDQCTSLRTFLVETDRVKFAGHLPGAEEIESTWEHALGFVEATVPVAVEEGTGDQDAEPPPERLEAVGGAG